MVTIIKERRDFITPYRFGAVGDAEAYNNTVTTSGSSAITNPTDAPFKPSHVGKEIFLANGAAGGNMLATTIAGYVSASQVVLATNALVSGTTSIVIGTDDTVAIQAAIAYAKKRSKGLILDGAFLTGPLSLPSRSGLIGASRSSAMLYLKPGSATVNGWLLRNAAASDYGISVEDMSLNGLRAFHKDVNNQPLLTINTLQHAGGGTTVPGEVQNLYRNLQIVASGRAAIKYAGLGNSVFEDIIISNATYGLDLTSSGNNARNIATSATMGLGFSINGGSSYNRFTDCTAARSGWSPPVGDNGDGFKACWSINDGHYNKLTNCEAKESWGCGFIITSGHRNTLTTCAAVDVGCLYPEDGLGSNSSSAARAGFQMTNANENHFNACLVSTFAHATNRASHAVNLTGTSADNEGRIITDKAITAFGAGKIGRNSSGVGNTLAVDGESVNFDQDDSWYTMFRSY